jgi:hypothetical protein
MGTGDEGAWTPVPGKSGRGRAPGERPRSRAYGQIGHGDGGASPSPVKSGDRLRDGPRHRQSAVGQKAGVGLGFLPSAFCLRDVELRLGSSARRSRPASLVALFAASRSYRQLSGGGWPASRR